MSAAADDRAENLRLIRDSAAAIVPAGGDLKRIRALRFTEAGFDRAVWAEMGALGWPGLLVPESLGGSGLGMAEFCAVAEALGAGLAPEPLIGCGVVAPVLPDDLREAVMAGARVVLPAWQERANMLPLSGRGDGSAISLGATPHPGPLPQGEREKTFTTRKLFIEMAGGADGFLVANGADLVVIDRHAQGVRLATERTQDGGHFGTLTLDAAHGTAVAGDFALAMERATLATAAYLLGVMDRAFTMTLDYLRTRQQFGRAIGTFQSLQHRAADLKMQVALTRASVESAAVTMDTATSLPLIQAAVSRAKARAAEASLLVTRQAIQLHGGIGYTDEADIGLFLRRAMVLANLYGSAALHRARFMAVAPEQDD